MVVDYISLKEKLLAFDIITFDIFDTLITRKVLHPTDVFKAVEIRSRNLTDRPFAEERVRAEQDACRLYGDDVGICRIYQILHDRFSYTDAQCEALQRLEFETELLLTAPRKAMRRLLTELLRCGKRIILCSDMYLSSDQIGRLLQACGYPEGLDIRVSCECGGTKSAGTLWKKLFATLPPDRRTVHVGDNEQGDYRVLKQMHREAVLIPGGFRMFAESPLYDYLCAYENRDIGCSLVLGYLVNCACFNSPFPGENRTEEQVAVWGGAAFACFMDFLVQNRDDSRLLFVTREGYFLQKIYERYCRSAALPPQENSLFYASRTACVAAMITSEEALQDAMKKPGFHGTLGEFTRGRLNFRLPADSGLEGLEIQLPNQQHEVFRKLRPWFPEIFANGAAQKQAYRAYTEQIRRDGQSLTVVDVGYNGTIQFALSRILEEPVGGLYMFLNEGACPTRIGCPCAGMGAPRSGVHPIYENMMFLEAVMQVPYGQLRRMELVDGKPTPSFNSDANFSAYISRAQEQFCCFAEWIGAWKKRLGGEFRLNFDLAEAIWVCLLKFRMLPPELMDSFWLTDDYCGTPLWKYDDGSQCWVGKNSSTPLDFQLIRSGEHLELKQRLKQFVKTHIPCCLYDWACGIWMKYIK